MKKIVVIIGTARSESATSQIAPFIIEKIKTYPEIEITTIDVRDYPQTATSGLSSTLFEQYQKTIITTDGIIIITPEYNHSFPGELKMLLDNLKQEYTKKPVGICGISSGPFGGTRMIQSLEPVLLQMGMIPIRSHMHIGEVDRVMSDIQSGADTIVWEKRINRLLDDIIDWVA